MITGYGVAEAVRHYYETYGGDVKGRKPLCKVLGCRLSSRFLWLKWVQSYRYNRQRWRFNKQNGFVRALFLAKDGNTLVAENMIPLKK
jgi:hypothetical protein